MYRCDRVYTAVTGKGGGVLVAIDNLFASDQLSFPGYASTYTHDDLEACKVSIGKIKVICICVYFPPGSDLSRYGDMLTNIESYFFIAT